MALTMVVNGLCSATGWSHHVQPRLYLASATVAADREGAASQSLRDSVVVAAKLLACFGGLGPC
jgi:hypothetical protein